MPPRRQGPRRKRDQVVVGTSRLTLAPPLHVTHTSAGDVLNLGLPERFDILLSGSANPYAWSRVIGTTGGGWANDPSGESGSAAYDRLNQTGLDGEVVEALRDYPGGELRFTFHRRGTMGEDCHPTTCVHVSKAEDGSAWVGATVRLNEILHGSNADGPLIGEGVTDSGGDFCVTYPDNIPYYVTVSVVDGAGNTCGKRFTYSGNVPCDGFHRYTICVGTVTFDPGVPGMLIRYGLPSCDDPTGAIGRKPQCYGVHLAGATDNGDGTYTAVLCHVVEGDVYPCDSPQTIDWYAEDPGKDACRDAGKLVACGTATLGCDQYGSFPSDTAMAELSPDWVDLLFGKTIGSDGSCCTDACPPNPSDLYEGRAIKKVLYVTLHDDLCLGLFPPPSYFGTYDGVPIELDFAGFSGSYGCPATWESDCLTGDFFHQFTCPGHAAQYYGAMKVVLTASGGTASLKVTFYPLGACDEEAVGCSPPPGPGPVTLAFTLYSTYPASPAHICHPTDFFLRNGDFCDGSHYRFTAEVTE